jgi:hypothetical protein
VRLRQSESATKQDGAKEENTMSQQQKDQQARQQVASKPIAVHPFAPDNQRLAEGTRQLSRGLTVDRVKQAADSISGKAIREALTQFAGDAFLTYATAKLSSAGLDPMALLVEGEALQIADLIADDDQ